MQKANIQIIRKKIFLQFFLFLSVALIVLSSSFIVSATPETSRQKRAAGALIFCLQHIVDTDDDISDFSDMFHDGGDRELAVVGLDLDKTNGVMTCLEVVDIAGQLIGDTTTSEESRNWVMNNVLPEGGKLSDYSGGKVRGDSVIDNTRNFISSTLLPLVQDAGTEDIALSVLPLAQFCFNFSSEPFRGSPSDRDFEASGKTGQKIYATYEFISDDKVRDEYSLDENNGVDFNPANGNTNSSVGDIELGFELNSTNLDGNFNGGWDSNFYPAGQEVVYANSLENNTWSSSFYGNNSVEDRDAELGILSCSFMKDNKDILFPFYTIDANGELAVNGITGSTLREQGAPDINLGFGAAANPTCESSGFSLSWIFCPIVNGALDAMDWMFRTIIEPFLLFTPLTTNDDDVAYKIWQSFRTIGNILLVFGLLFIVFGQSIGGGLVDAYTAKKAMPRILAAAILINLSYFIVAFVVDIFNVVGMGIGQLITAPLGESGSFSFATNNFLSAGGLIGLFLGGRWVIGLVTTGGFMPLLLLVVLLPMLLVTISIFATLIIRRGLIILLAVISPVALALYVLPNTEKYAKKWFDLLIKALIVYPIIIAIFAIADVLSVLMFNSNQGGLTTVNQFVALIILFVPFFLIPFAFKLAGGTLATISGAVTSMGKKRLEHYKGQEMDPHSRINQAKSIRKSARTAGDGHKNEFFTRLSSWRKDGSGTWAKTGESDAYGSMAKRGVRRGATWSRSKAKAARLRVTEGRYGAGGRGADPTRDAGFLDVGAFGRKKEESTATPSSTSVIPPTPGSTIGESSSPMAETPRSSMAPPIPGSIIGEASSPTGTAPKPIIDSPTPGRVVYQSPTRTTSNTKQTNSSGKSTPSPSPQAQDNGELLIDRERREQQEANIRAQVQSDITDAQSKFGDNQPPPYTPN